MSNVRIDIAAVWKGAQAFNKATKATKKLDAQVASLGKTLLSVYAAKKTIDFSKKLVNAFTADQASAAILSNTVKNLGLSFADVDIKTFIDKLSLAAGVADDELRPAMQRLLTTTGSVAKSQALLQNAIDIAKGSGQSLETVVLDLSNAYVGNNKGLKKYTLGLSAAELKTASFDKILAAFNKNFSGANSAYLNTYAGQIQKLTVASKEAQETIGGGLVDAFKILAGDTSISDLADKMATLATNIADFFRGLAQGFKDLAAMPVIHQMLQLAGILLKILGGAAGAVVDPFTKEGARRRSAALAPASSNSFLTEHMAASNAAKQKAAEAAATKRAKTLAAAQNKQTKALKDQALLKKQSALFDLSQIELIAALKGKLSDEDRKRAELQLALLQGDEETAAKLTAQIADAIDKTGNLKKYLNDFTLNNDPFKAWMDSLEKIAAKAATLGAAPGTAGNVGNTQVMPQTNAQDYSGFKLDLNGAGASGSAAQFGASTPWAIQVVMNDKVVAEAVQNQSLNGNQGYIDRTRGGFNW